MTAPPSQLATDVVVLKGFAARDGRPEGRAHDPLAALRELYPDVAVYRRRVRGGTRRAVVEASTSAQLVVIGTRPRAGWNAALPATVSRAALRQADCSVAVIPEQRTPLTVPLRPVSQWDRPAGTPWGGPHHARAAEGGEGVAPPGGAESDRTGAGRVGRRTCGRCTAGPPRCTEGRPGAPGRGLRRRRVPRPRGGAVCRGPRVRIRAGAPSGRTPWPTAGRARSTEAPAIRGPAR